MNFEITSWLCQRPKEFIDTPSEFYYDYDVLEPDVNKNKFCCFEMRGQAKHIRVRVDGNCTVNQKVIGLSLNTNPEEGDSINLNFCPNCSEKITYIVQTPISLIERQKLLELRK